MRCRRLLVLAGEIVLADRAADLLEHGERLALGMQGLAICPGDAAALQRRRRLLILAGKVVFADRASDAVEGFERLAIGVQRLTPRALEAPRSPDGFDPMHLIGFGDRWKAQDIPRLLGQYVADKIVLVQPLHDDDDGAMPFVVQAAVERVVKPPVGGSSLRLGERLLRF